MRQSVKRNSRLAHSGLGAALLAVALAIAAPSAAQESYRVRLGPRSLYPAANQVRGKTDIPVMMRDALQNILLGTRLLAVKPRIMGGEPAPSGAFPWAASLELKLQRRRDAHFCGGAFIAPQWVITAAHCVKPDSVKAIDVLGGTNTLETGGAVYSVDRINVNEKYNTASQDYDVALVHVTKPFTGKTVRLLTAADAERYAEVGGFAIAVGWGLTAEGTEVSNILRQVTVQIVSNRVCNGLAAYSGAVTDRMVCAGFPEGGRDSCQGDSGGPLMVSDKQGGYFLAGVVSWGEGCGRPNKFGVYTRVSAIADWVAEKIGTRAAPVASRATRVVAASPPALSPPAESPLPPAASSSPSLPAAPVATTVMVTLPEPRPPAIGPSPGQRAVRFREADATTTNSHTKPLYLGPRRLYRKRAAEAGSGLPIVMRDAIQYLATGKRLLAIKPRVIGGEPAPRGTFPWMASIELKGRARQGNHFCGGSFIAPDWVMTAAHCVKPSSAPGIEVLGGSLELDRGGTLYPVDRVIVNEKYDNGTQDYDVALLHLSKRFDGRTVSLLTPAEAKRLTAPGSPAVTAGWGLTSEDGGVSNILRKVNLKIVSQAACNAPAAYNGSIDKLMICAGFARGGKDACQGDSGGPMMVKDASGNYVQAGIVSWGEGCGKPEKFGVYTRVSQIQPWVASKIGGRASPSAQAPPRAARTKARRRSHVPSKRTVSKRDRLKRELSKRAGPRKLPRRYFYRGRYYYVLPDNRRHRTPPFE